MLVLLTCCSLCHARFVHKRTTINFDTSPQTISICCSRDCPNWTHLCVLVCVPSRSSLSSSSPNSDPTMEHQLVHLLKDKTEKMVDSLPNEMLRAILVKLEVLKLIAIRSVSRRWQVVIEGICAEQRSLAIRSTITYMFNPTIHFVSKRFNQLVDFDKNECVVLKVAVIQSGPYTVAFMCTDLCNLVGRLFPRIEHLVVLDSSLYLTVEGQESVIALLKKWSSTLVTLYLPYRRLNTTEMCTQIDRLTALKRLAFGYFESLARTTLARLEHCQFESSMHIGSYFGANCSSLYLGGYTARSDIADWPRVNAPLVERLKRLSFGEDCQQPVLPFVCSRFSALEMLEINFYPSYPRKVYFTADLISLLAQLPNLSQLSIGSCWFNLDTLETSSRMDRIRVLTLSVFGFAYCNRICIDRLFRVLSAIFPNIVQLTIEHDDQRIRDEAAQYLGRFVHLRKHSIVEIVSPY